MAKICRRLRAFSISKTADTPNEDRWLASLDGGVIAVSDGASISYDSSSWANILCERFVTDRALTPAWVRSAAEEYAAAYDREAMPWMQQGAFDRGSFASLLGVAFSDDFDSVEVNAIGDSIFMLADTRTLIRAIPNMRPEDFDLSPQLLSTNSAENRFFADDYFAELPILISLTDLRDPHCLLMTDALGRWVLEGQEEQRLGRLIAIQSADDFAQLVESERSAGSLKRDDTTVVIVGR